jgi:hypothetical protein
MRVLEEKEDICRQPCLFCLVDPVLEIPGFLIGYGAQVNGQYLVTHLLHTSSVLKRALQFCSCTAMKAQRHKAETAVFLLYPLLLSAFATLSLCP